MSIEELKNMADEIENGLEECRKDLKKSGTVAIKIQSFVNLLNKQDQEDKEIKILKIKMKSYQQKIKELSDRRNKEKDDFEKEMADAKLRVRKITEASDFSVDKSDNEFFSDQNSKIDGYLLSAMDSIESIKRQGVYIDRINSRLRSGLVRMGVGSEYLDKIESRFSRDKGLFLVLFLLVIFLIILLRFFF